MKRDFTLAKYEDMCNEIIQYKCIPITVERYFSDKNIKKFIILRHDVDRQPENALDMAISENKLGIKSTYYFRTTTEVFKPKIIRKIREMGHEIGYHYEVLDKAGGDFERAIELFEKELKQFQELGIDVKTICMHGNPLTGYRNTDLWNHYDFKEFGIIGEPYLSIDYTQVVYFSDTGRTWSGQYSVKDFVNTKNPYSTGVKNTDDIIQLIREGEIEKMCIATHPERWNDKFVPWLKQLVFQSSKNKIKTMIRWYKKK